ncbi:MAG: amidohydrolase family protein, partial [Planctomycetota bacterium]
MDLHLDWQRQIEQGRMLGPTIYTAGALLDGSPPIWEGSTVLETAESAQAVVRKQAEDGYQFVKVYNRLKPDVYDAIVRTAREVDMPVIGHVPDAVGLERVLDSGQTCIEHLTGWIAACQTDDSPVRGETDLRKRQLGVHYFDDDRMKELARACAEKDVWNCVTMVVMQKFSYMTQPDRFANRPEMRYVSPGMKTQWQPQNDFRSRGSTDDRWEAMRKGNEVRRRITAALHDAGADILLGTDTPNPWVVPGFSIHEELANLTAAGLSHYETLRTGTVNPAWFLGESDEFGTVEVGKRADLMLLTANPLEDVTNVQRRAGVMVR